MDFNEIIKTLIVAILGSLPALAGVIMSNKHNRKNLKKQLKNETKISAEERTLNLRRDVYLQLAEHIVEANQYLSHLPKVDFDEPGYDRALTNLRASIQKLQIISDTETQTLASEYLKKMSELGLECLQKTAPMHKIRNDIKVLEGLHSKASAEVDRILAARQILTESGEVDQKAFDSLSSAFDFFLAQMQDFSAKAQSTRLQFAELYVDYGKSLINSMQERSDLYIQLIVQLRKDVMLSSNIEIMTLQQKESYDVLIKKYDEMIDAVRTTFSK